MDELEKGADDVSAQLKARRLRDMVLRHATDSVEEVDVINAAGYLTETDFWLAWNLELDPRKLLTTMRETARMHKCEHCGCAPGSLEHYAFGN